jgi:peptidoglycan/LPS O-acetylase OafA/YrhL
VAVAVVLHVYFEKPVMAFLRRRFLHKLPAIEFKQEQGVLSASGDSA